jgi:hypothetical protein
MTQMAALLLILMFFSFWRRCEILHSKSGFAEAELLLEIVQVLLLEIVQVLLLEIVQVQVQHASYSQEHLQYCPMQRRCVQDLLRVQRLHVIQRFLQNKFTRSP